MLYDRIVGRGVAKRVIGARELLAAFCLAFAVSAAGAQAPAIGVVAPLTGPYALLGRQVEAGARAALEGAAVPLVADDACTAEGGRAAAERLVEARVRLVVGFVCTESAEAALPLLRDASIPTISPALRTDSLTLANTKTRFLFFRVAPRASHEAEALATVVRERWRDALFALVDDGTIYGRGLTEPTRFAVEQSGLKPVVTDTFRPQLDNQVALVGRLRRAGATHVLVGGDRDDVAIVARDAARQNVDLTVLGGEALRAAGAVPLPVGVLMVGLPAWADLAPADTLARLRADGVEPEGYVLPAYAAAEIAGAAIGRSDATARGLVPLLAETRFETAIGPVRFDAGGDLADNPYKLFRFDGLAFQPVPPEDR